MSADCGLRIADWNLICLAVLVVVAKIEMLSSKIHAERALFGRHARYFRSLLLCGPFAR